MTPALEIHTVVSVPFEENTYVVWRPGHTEALVIDPGLEPDLILTCLEQHGLTVAAILNTHGHADHIGGNETLKKAFPTAPLIVGRDEAFMLVDARANLSASYGMPIVSPPPDRTVVEGEILSLAGIDLEVRDIPGHSKGHVVFVVAGMPTIVFGGDVLFRGSIGRTDFPGGSLARLESGIRRNLYTLPDDTIVYPGHGPVTTVGNERRTNPFVNG
jgi:glyoxylase-like metal-dependent hydrolase (beta-lactamase superfamily II)